MRCQDRFFQGSDMTTAMQTVVLAGAVPKRYAVLPDASAYCGLSVRTLRGMLARHELTGYRPRPGRVLIDLRELDAVVRRGAKRPGTRGKYPRTREEVHSES